MLVRLGFDSRDVGAGALGATGARATGETGAIGAEGGGPLGLEGVVMCSTATISDAGFTWEELVVSKVQVE